MRITLLFFCLCFLCTLSAQNGLVIGLNGRHLVRINVENGELIPFRQLEGLPAGTELTNLVYVPRDTAFYTIFNFRAHPELLKIRATGTWERIGTFTTPDQEVFFCEGMTYDEAKDRLYVSGSLDGAIASDKKSETLLIVDRQTAQCSIAATLRQGVPPDDFDTIAMFNGRLFGLDGVPGRNTTYIYPFNPTHFDGGQLFAGTKQNIPYFTMNDVLVIGQLLYFPHHPTQGWYYFDLRARRWQQVGTLHGPALIGPIKVTGLAYYPLAQA